MAEPILSRSVAPIEADELPDTRLFWRWVAKSVRPYTGWVLLAAGVIAIVAGYLGVSRQALVAKQLPYLISGGIFGLALVAFGTFYLATEELRRDSGRLDRLERMVLELHAVLLARPDAPDAESIAQAVAVHEGGYQANGSGAAHVAAEGLVALPESQRYHRVDCRMVQGKPDAEQVTPRVIQRRQLQPCGMCDPVVQIGV